MTKKEQKAEITRWLEGERDDIVRDYIPASTDEAEFLAGLRLVLLTNEYVGKASETEEGRANLACEFRKAASWGISVNPADGFVSFYPQDRRIIAHLDAAGLVEKLLRDGAARKCRTYTIYENDDLEIFEGSDGDEFKLRRALKEPGEISGFMVAVVLHDGTKAIHHITADQARDWGERFGRGQKGLKPMWRNNFEGAGQKTVLRQLLTKLRVRVSQDIFDEAVAETIEAAEAEIMDDPKGPASPEDLRSTLEREATEEEEVEDSDVTGDGEPTDGDNDLFGGDYSE
jgi:recombinational DNA repair protein RecT